MKTFFKICLYSLYFFSASSQTKEIFYAATYNVENLFDATHDQGKNDWEFLPKKIKDSSQEAQDYCHLLPEFRKKRCLNLDWTPELVKVKICNISNVLLSLIIEKNPTLLFLQEVENATILNQLNESLGQYKFPYVIHKETSDPRGIDMAILSRYPPLGPAKFISIPSDPILAPKPLREILTVDVKIKGLFFRLYSNHWPSRANSSLLRSKYAKTLYNAISSAHHKYHHLIAGDFNTLYADWPNPYFELLKDEYENFTTTRIPFREPWIYGVKRYTENDTTYFDKKTQSLQDLDNIFIIRGSPESYFLGLDYNEDPARYSKPWFSKTHCGFKNTSRIITIERFKDQFSDFFIHDLESACLPVPVRFNPYTQTGYSDHFPFVIAIRTK